jgi:hypothetical protein
MDLSVIISISGKPGLFKVLAQSKNGLIVESLLDGKKVPVHGSSRISTLQDISIYTYEEDVPLKEVFQKMFTFEKGNASLSHKDSASALRNRLLEFMPDYDQERVYDSDVKKLFNWYNLLQSKGLVDLEEEGEENKEIEQQPEEPAKKATKSTAKKTAKAKVEVAEESKDKE